MQKAPVLKGSGLAPIDDEATNVHVFGKNLEERVVACEDEEEPSNKNEVLEDSRGDDLETIKKRKFETITGEEDEQTAFQGDFKLFVWDITTSNWTEKGRGQLKLNDNRDADGHQSRLIMRTGGTYRIILNVAIQQPTFRVIANTKTNIRFTDSQNVWAASGSNAMQLGDLIDRRLVKIDIRNNKVNSQSHKLETKTSDKIDLERNNKVQENQNNKSDRKDEKVTEDQSKETDGKEEEEEEETVSDKSNDIINDHNEKVDSLSHNEFNKQSEKADEDQAAKEKGDQPEEVDDQRDKIDNQTSELVSDQGEGQSDKEEEQNNKTEAPREEEEVVKDESSGNVSHNEEKVDDEDCEQHETKKLKAE